MHIRTRIINGLLLVAFAKPVSAQSTVIAITVWMQPSFAEGATSTLSTATERPL